MAVTPEAGNDPIRNEPASTGACADEQGNTSPKTSDLAALSLPHRPEAERLDAPERKLRRSGRRTAAAKESTSYPSLYEDGYRALTTNSTSSNF
jgi:hypothetical protein